MFLLYSCSRSTRCWSTQPHPPACLSWMPRARSFARSGMSIRAFWAYAPKSPNTKVFSTLVHIVHHSLEDLIWRKWKKRNLILKSCTLTSSYRGNGTITGVPVAQTGYVQSSAVGCVGIVQQILFWPFSASCHHCTIRFVITICLRERLSFGVYLAMNLIKFKHDYAVMFVMFCSMRRSLRDLRNLMCCMAVKLWWFVQNINCSLCVFIFCVSVKTLSSDYLTLS